VLRPQAVSVQYRFYRAWKGSGEPDINELKLAEFVKTYERKLQE
jgi:hypothetical protein